MKGHDLLQGKDGDDLLKRHSDSDTLNIGLSHDTLKGGEGADRFLLSKGSDQILDFKPHQDDSIQLPASLQFIQKKKHLLPLDPTFNFDTRLHNTTRNALIQAQPELLN